MSNHSLKIPFTVGLLWVISSGGLFRECPVHVFCSTIVFFLVLIAKNWLIAVWFKILGTCHWVGSGHHKLPSSSKYRGLNPFQYTSVGSSFHLLLLQRYCLVPREEQEDCHALNLLVVSWLLMFYLNLSFRFICSLAFFCSKNSEFCCASKAGKKKKSYSSDVDDKMLFLLISTNNYC